MKEYNSKKIEKKWQKVWDDSKLYEAKDSSKKPKFYGLIEFPFPSGDGMHTGHLRSNTAIDIISRKRRMQGYNVLYPIGWDAFGLPTENYAIKTGQHPKVVTKKNTDNFRRQLKSAGFSFDWSREVNTTDPTYYKWTQWIFLQMFEKGLAYKKKMVINWCPKDKIGLANEEVINGCCERCGTPVEKREKEQWMLAITQYADRLDKDLDTVDYVEKIKIQQRNWIGRSEGAEFDFRLLFTKNPEDNKRRGPDGKPAQLTVFTTRPDTLFGVTYIVLSPEHPWVTLATDENHDVLSNKEEVIEYIKSVKNKTDIERTATDKEKTGVELKGVKAIHPATGEEVPMFVADYVLAHYGTGVVMAVPAHDERDYQFAQKYNLPVKEVIEPVTGKVMPNEEFRQSIVAIVENPKTGKVLCIEWGKELGGTLFVGGGIEKDEDPVKTAEREILEETGYKNLKLISVAGKSHHHYYAFSKKVARNIEVTGIHFELVNEDKVDQKLEENEKNKFSVAWLSKDDAEKKVEDENHALLFQKFIRNKPYTSSGILTRSNMFSGIDSEKAKKEITKKYGRVKVSYKLRDWVFSRQRYWGEPIPMVYCEACAEKQSAENQKGTIKYQSPGWIPVKEKELPVTLPNVKNYQPTDTGESPLSTMKSWTKTTCPVCKGPATRETDTMPNWAGSSWYFLRYADAHNTKALASEKKLTQWHPVDWYNGGMEHTTLHLLYSRFWNKFLFDIGVAPTSEPYQKRTSHGLILAADGEKMSKSRGNVVSPDSIIENYGADTLRLYEMFMGPFDQTVAWSTDGIVGPRRFVERIWRIASRVQKTKVTSEYEMLQSSVHKTIQKVSDDIESMQFNTGISAMMMLANDFEKVQIVPQSLFELFLQILAPYAPHITEELWAELGNKGSIHISPWPEADNSKIKEEIKPIMVQVDGKIRGQLEPQNGLDDDQLKEIALSLDTVKKWVEGKQIRKVIVVKGKLISIVTG